MKKIESFRVDHTKLQPGVYISRVDFVGELPVTTYDLRLIRPNTPDILSAACMHTIEHLGATYLRNSPLADDVIYFGPMGCRTGFYLILKGERAPLDLQSSLTDTFEFIVQYEGEIHGASAVECGNYADMDLLAAKTAGADYLDVLGRLSSQNTIYSTQKKT